MPAQRTPLIPAALFVPGTVRNGRASDGSKLPFVRVELVVEYPETDHGLPLRHSDRGSWFSSQAAWMPRHALNAVVRTRAEHDNWIDEQAAPALAFARSRSKTPSDLVVSHVEAVAWSRGLLLEAS